DQVLRAMMHLVTAQEPLRDENGFAAARGDPSLLDPEASDQLVEIAGAIADREAAARLFVEGRGRPRDLDGMARERVDHPEHEADAPSGLRTRRDKKERIVVEGLVRYPGAVEAELVCETS